MFWDLMQQLQISQAQSDAHSAKYAAAGVQTESLILKDRIQTLEETVERLSLVTMAMAEILRDRFNVAQKEMEAKVQEIDLRDGKIDGLLRPTPRECARCHQRNSVHRRRCLYCGEALPVHSPLFAPPTIKTDNAPDWDAPPKKS